MEQFVYLYPIKEYLEFEIERIYRSFDPPSLEAFSEEYFKILNKAINKRYRKNGFEINWVLFNDRSIYTQIKSSEEDRIVFSGMNFIEHTTPDEEGNYTYPDEDYVLNQIPSERMVFGGFHVFDCVERMAKRAHERGIDVLVDEDLTNFLGGRILFEENFNPAYYDPILALKGLREIEKELYLKSRKNKIGFLQS